MTCRFCNINVTFPCHIIRSDGKEFIGYGLYCCPNCALRDLRKENYGDSDYYEAYALTTIKYSKDGTPFSLFENNYDDYVKFLPHKTKDFSILEKVQEIKKDCKYEVKRTGNSRKTKREVLANEYFTGKCKRVESGATLCPTK